MIEVRVDPPIRMRTHYDPDITGASRHKETGATAMTDWMSRVLHNANALTLDARFAYVAISFTAISIALLRVGELWGRARARRRTERAIAQTERRGPPEAQTWEHTHSVEKK
jgi:hypothetical protein